MISRVLISVLDSINYTTMTYNEFVLYRNKHYKDEKQVILLTGADISIPKEDIPKEIEIHKVGKNPLIIRKALQSIIAKREEESLMLAIHFHSIRGAFSTIIAMIGMGLRKHTLYTIHSTFPGFRFHNKVFCFLDSLYSSFTTCVSMASYVRFPSILKSIKNNHIMPLQNGVNCERIDDFLNQKKEEIIEDTRTVKFIYVARLIPLKNHRFLIDVLDRLPNDLDIKFIFVGLEDDNKAIRNYAIEKGIVEKIEFTGLIPREKVYDRLRQSDVYISSSTLEGLPISVLEGMYCGLPSIISDIPQHREVAEGCNTVTVLPFDEELWSKEIIKYATMSRAQRMQMGESCKRHAYEKFSLKKMHEKYDIIYEVLYRKK